MAEKEKVKEEAGFVYFVEVPSPGQKAQRNTLITVQKNAVFVNGVQTEPAYTDMIGANGQGLITLDKSSPYHAARMTALQTKQKKVNNGGVCPRLIGPFDTQEEAFKEMHRVRPKTDAERASMLSIENKERTDALKAKDEEIANLRKQIEAAQKAQK